MRRSPLRPSNARRRSRRLTRAVGALAAGVLAATATVGVIVATAAVPTFPDNIVVFPDRDFISLEGFQDHVGETATVEIRRGSTVMGSARSVIAEGDVAFEINHPGGVCWGNDTNLKVTPDIRPGDVALIRFEDGSSQDTTVQDAQASDAVQTGLTVTVSGHVGASVNKNFFEQRIINPDMVDLSIGRRDIRALPGPVVPSDRGPYSSGIAFPTADTFVATYVFQDQAAADAAADAPLGERAMTWQEEDADGNRQGLTIAEFGELGGPGFGGCPAGPADQQAPAGTAAFVRSDDRTSVRVTWTPATAVPGGAPVTGYFVEALGATLSAANQRAGTTRHTPADATTATITGLDPNEDYSVEVRSIAGPRMSEAFPLQGGVPDPDGDTTAPPLNVSPAPSATSVVEASSVTLSSSDPNAQFFFTTDGSSVIDGDLPSDTAKLYTGPIPITQRTTLHVMAIDAAGNNTLAEGEYAPPTAVAPAAPTGLTATAGQLQATLRWNASDPSITGYGVQLFTAAGPAGPLREIGTERVLTVTGLTAGTAYTFSVKARNSAGYGSESARSAPFTPTALTDRVTIGTARWKAGDFRVTGTASVVGSIVSIRTGSATGPVIASGAATAAAPPATGGEYDIRLRNGAAPATNPGQIWATSNGGGVAGPFTVSNR